MQISTTITTTAIERNPENPQITKANQQNEKWGRKKRKQATIKVVSRERVKKNREAVLEIDGRSGGVEVRRREIQNEVEVGRTWMLSYIDDVEATIPDYNFCPTIMEETKDLLVQLQCVH
ncbi:hypothetical protein Tco_0428892 [Tanacetum coccineum]